MGDGIRFRGNRFQDIILKFPCPQKILMVTDGSLSFGIDGFGLSEFVGIVQAAGHTVSTAHRSGVGPTTIPGSYNFATAATAVTTTNYDQVWLFGFSSAPLGAPEQQVLAKFMASGGGVFATGDHGALGSGMGAVLPRVRGMRNWSSIPMSSPERLDTVIDPGTDNKKQFEDQSDDIAQRIFPVFLSNGGDAFQMATWSPHPVLRHTSGAVDALPDHPHESECLAPTPVGGVTVAGVEEWPAAPSGARPAPIVVARSISGGRFVESGAPTATGTKPPVVPRCFGAISAYDGDAANVGRIVCDATWHHFVNINLNGTGSGRGGLYVAGNPTPEYEKIKQYYRNAVRWLAPKGRRLCWPWLKVALARFDFEMLEELRPHPHPCPWDPLMRIGTLVEEVLVREHGPGVTEEIVAEFLDSAGSPEPLRRFFVMQTPEELARRAASDIAPVLFSRDVARRAVLASVMNFVLHALPENEQELAKLMEKHDDLANKTVIEGVRAAETALREQMRRALKATTALVESFKATERAVPA
jgi:hypothetical protein